MYCLVLAGNSTVARNFDAYVAVSHRKYVSKPKQFQIKYNTCFSLRNSTAFKRFRNSKYYLFSPYWLSCISLNFSYENLAVHHWQWHLLNFYAFIDLLIYSAFLFIGDFFSFPLILSPYCPLRTPFKVYCQPTLYKYYLISISSISI